MHGKEAVIAPLLTEALGVEMIVPPSFNTDQFGTFSGETERTGTPLETALLKCKAAMQVTGCDLAIASEGSFGPHPFIGFVTANEELLVLLDEKNKITIAAKELSTATNFNGGLFTTWHQVQEFAISCQFPSHALLLKIAKDDYTFIQKGIHDWKELEQQVSEFLTTHQQVYVETDMRAMHNPSRQLVIAAATKKLIQKINQVCTHCGTPGFDVTEVISGLPCELCGTPTRTTKAFRYVCHVCSFEKTESFPHGKVTEDPMYCDICNP
jgi:hypothetical protein